MIFLPVRPNKGKGPCLAFWLVLVQKLNRKNLELLWPLCGPVIFPGNELIDFGEGKNCILIIWDSGINGPIFSLYKMLWVPMQLMQKKAMTTTCTYITTKGHLPHQFARLIFLNQHFVRQSCVRTFHEHIPSSFFFNFFSAYVRRNTILVLPRLIYY